MGGNFVNQQKENCMKNNIFKIIILLFMIQVMKPVVNSPLLGPDIIQRNIQQLMFLF